MQQHIPTAPGRGSRLTASFPCVRSVAKLEPVERHLCNQDCTVFLVATRASWAQHGDDACDKCGGARFTKRQLGDGDRSPKLTPVRVRVSPALLFLAWQKSQHDAIPISARIQHAFAGMQGM